MKKVFKKTSIIIVAMIVLGMIGNLMGCGGVKNAPSTSSSSTQANVQETEAATPEPTEEAVASEPQSDVSNAIILTGGELGEYGTAEKLENGEDVKEYIAYRVPAGTYTVTNIGANMTQVTVYQDGTITNEDGIVEQVMSDTKPLVLDKEASATVTIKEGEYISIFEPAIIELVAE